MYLFLFYSADKEANWLKMKMKHVQPLNLYYYRKLWNPPGENLVEVVSGMKLNAEMNMEPLATWLSQVHNKKLT